MMMSYDVLVIHRTASAVLVTTTGDEEGDEVWVPLSRCALGPENANAGDLATIEVSEADAGRYGLE